MSRTDVRYRRRQLTGMVLVVSAAAVLAGPVGRAVSAPPAARAAEHRYVVRVGDTLWSIARAVAPASDPRPVVDAIVEANRLELGRLIPGRTLILPGVH